MPCQSYDRENDYDRAKELRDKLARIACKALTKLDSLGYTKHDEETTKWWTAHKLADKRAAEEKRARQEKIRNNELAVLKKLQAKYGRNV